MEELLDGKYEYIEKAGSGGSGTVYKAYDRHLKQYKAVKEYRNENGFSEEEAEILKGLRHQALPTVTDYIETEDGNYLVMEYIEGVNLKDYITANRCVKKRKAIEWATEIGEVMIYLHERVPPVIYRDLKPANIMITEEGKIRLIDFGSAYIKSSKWEKQGVLTGTCGYAAPEQLSRTESGPPDETCDVYGLGATLHHMLTGSDPAKPPYIRGSIRCYDRTLSPSLEKIVKKSTDPDRLKRYESMRLMTEALKRCEGKERILHMTVRISAVLYFIVLLFLELLFLAECRLVQNEGILYHGRSACAAAAAIVGICLLREAVRKITEHNLGSIRIHKNVYLSAKKGRGLLLLFCTIIAVIWFPMPKAAAAKEENLNVIVKNEIGQKILIRYDAVYSLQDDMKLELPLTNMPEGEYILRLELTSVATNEIRSRTFRVKP